MAEHNRRWRWALLLSSLSGCTGAPSNTVGASARAGAGSQSIAASADTERDLARIHTKIDAAASLDAAGFAEKVGVPFSALGNYEPAAAPGMDQVQKSALALNEAELRALSRNGFVVSARQSFPSFVYGYNSIYAQDLPLYISADSILYAVHQSYDSMLESVEAAALIPQLTSLLNGMQSQLATASLSEPMRSQADVYLTTARSLLSGGSEQPLDAADAPEVARLVELCSKAEGSESVSVFGLKRGIDFSQCSARGHYTDSEPLKRYFRTLIWLGRTDLRVIDILSDGSASLQRNQLEGAVVLRQLMDDAGQKSWRKLDAVLSAFTGEHDEMTPPQVDDLLRDLGVHDLGGLAELSDQRVMQALIDGGYGAQRVASQLAVTGLTQRTLPLARSFALLGQRYVLDSEVFSNVVYDRVKHGGAPYRMMPSPLDVAYTVLGNNQAGMLLAPELVRYAYAPDLYGMRVLADEHGSEFWQENLYNLWLGALRQLSPTADAARPTEVGLPSVAGTDAWGRRLLDAQLASWSELRHDTQVYAKQSYSAGAACQFPTAYVDPYPEFFAGLVAFAEYGRAALVDLGEASEASDYFLTLATVAATLRDMALDQRKGLPLSAEHLAFVNRAIHITDVCGTNVANGWYMDLFFGEGTSMERDPTIADVHTQPTDAFGNDVGRVLHVATGTPQLMVVSVDGCTGAQSYVGLVSSYYEQVTEKYERLTDEEWSSTLLSGSPKRPDWLPTAFTP